MGAGGIIIIRNAAVAVLSDPLFSGRIVEPNRSQVAVICTKDVNSWTDQEHQLMMRYLRRMTFNP